MERNKTDDRISGALFLIFIGSLILLVNFGYFSWINLFSFLFSFWPIFIVIWGIKILTGLLPFGKWINLALDVIVDIAIILILIFGYNSKTEWKFLDTFVVRDSGEEKKIDGDLDVAQSKFTGVESVNYRFEIGAAEFTIADEDQTDYLQTTGSYSKNIFKPEVKSEEDGKELNIAFSQKTVEKAFFHPWRVKSDFDFTTPNTITKTYDVELGAGKGILDIDTNMVQSTKVDIGAGEMTININEEINSSLDINVGAGKAKIYIPKGVGYTVEYNVGVGDFSVFRNKEKKSVGGLGSKGNISYNADSTNVLKIKINVGAGSVEIEEK